MAIGSFFTSFEWSAFINALILGISIASIWLIAALGLTIIYGAAGVINMAHGEFIMLGAYSSYMLQNFLELPFVLCVPASFLIVAAVGLVLERGLIRYLYKRPLDTLLATFGVSLVLMQGVRLIFGSDPKYIAVPPIFSSNIQFAFVNISVFRLVVLHVTMAIVAALWALFYRTRFGVQVRAVMQDKEMAASFGVNADRIYMLTFALGAGLAVRRPQHRPSDDGDGLRRAGLSGRRGRRWNACRQRGRGWRNGRAAIDLRLFHQRHLRSFRSVRADCGVPADTTSGAIHAGCKASLAASVPDREGTRRK